MKGIKIKALAVAVAAAFAAPAAFAQSNVTIYGVVDAGYSHTKTRSAAGVTTAVQAIESNEGTGGSRLGFQGSEDLGGGLKANFNLEIGMNTDTGAIQQGSGTLLMRQSWVGLSGGFGELRIGRDYDFTSLVSWNGEYCGYCGQVSPSYMDGVVARRSNTVKYQTPNFGGFSLGLEHSKGELTANATGNTNEVAAFYAAGPLSLAAAHRQEHKATGKQKGNYLTGNFSFGIGKVFALLGSEKNGTVSNERYANLGVGFKVGSGDLEFQYGKLKNKITTANSKRLAGVSYWYSLSKRTTVYAMYSDTKTDTGAKVNAAQTGLRIGF